VGGDGLFGERDPSLRDDRHDSIFHYVKAALDPDLLREIVDLTGPHPDAVVPTLRARVSHDIDLRFRLMFELRLGVRLAVRVARAHGAEAMSPFLDRDVVEVALRLPASLLTNNKPLLRSLSTRYFSASLQLPWKIGFAAAPIERLMANGSLGPLLDLLDDSRTRWRGVYRDSGLRRLIALYRTGRADRPWHAVLWQIVVFELFCRRFVDRVDRVVQSAAAAN
jgi:hypothetical protein